MKHQRSSGILLAVSSLPGPYGIGSLGAPARKFVDFLVEANQHYWQILPLVPPGEGASPYMSPSAFAGNPFLIDLDELAHEGLLTAEELRGAVCPDLDRVDYDTLWENRLELLEKAYLRAQDRPQQADNPVLPWLAEYARFSAIHDQYETPYWKWPEDTQPEPERVGFHCFLQNTFYRQWFHLKEYANRRGVRIMGDVPIYLSPDSVELCNRPQLFQMDETGRPAAVAGVPPDAFSDDGQLWGNPLYNWEAQEEVFGFWIERLSWCARIYDAVRIDHFRAIHTYWSVPVDAKSAKEGHWELGPGMPLLQAIQQVIPDLELIAEDLGDLDMKALHFVRNCGIDGMKVMVFAFDPVGESAYLPHNCPENSVVYTGTHDTPTFVQFLNEASPEEAGYARRYLRLREDEGLGWGVIAGAWACASRLAIAPMQDVLGLGKDARMNLPGTMGDHNWTWRVRQEALNNYVARALGDITRTYRRG